jgi:hypothetical protein
MFKLKEFKNSLNLNDSDQKKFKYLWDSILSMIRTRMISKNKMEDETYAFRSRNHDGTQRHTKKEKSTRDDNSDESKKNENFIPFNVYKENK